MENQTEDYPAIGGYQTKQYLETKTNLFYETTDDIMVETITEYYDFEYFDPSDATSPSVQSLTLPQGHYSLGTSPSLTETSKDDASSEANTPTVPPPTAPHGFNSYVTSTAQTETTTFESTVLYFEEVYDHDYMQTLVPEIPFKVKETSTSSETGTTMKSY